MPFLTTAYMSYELTDAISSLAHSKFEMGLLSHGPAKEQTC